MKLIKKNIRITFDEYTANEYYTGVVRSGGKGEHVTSARVNLPLDLIGKEVIIIVKKGGEKS
jgi:putative transposon-encoded protein